MERDERPDDPRAAATAGERRAANRRAERGTVRLTVQTKAIDGEAENVSPTGILFLSDADVRVSVEVEDDGVAVRRSGRLVRVQRLRGGRSGWAVEFD
jgi:hypothetical protein